MRKRGEEGQGDREKRERGGKSGWEDGPKE